MGSQAIDAPRVSMFIIEPEKLTIVTDPAHPLYDERIKLPLDESLVKNIMVYGIKVPVLIRKNGEVLEVVDGRQRVRAAIEANRRFEEEGGLAVKVRVVLEKGSDAEMMGVGILTNELRQGDDIIVKARKAKRVLDLNPDEGACALLFGVSVAHLRRWIKLLTTDTKVQKAVEAGEISATAAAELADLPRDQQIEALEKLTGEAAGGKKLTVGAAKRAVKRASGQVKHEKPPVRLLQKFYEAPELDPQDKALLGWVLGETGIEEAGMASTLEAIEKREAADKVKAGDDKKAEKAATKAEKQRIQDEKKVKKDEARAAKKAERDAKKAAKAAKIAEKKAKAAEKKEAVAAKKQMKKEIEAGKKELKKVAAQAKKEAEAKKKAEKKAAKDAKKQAKADVKAAKKAARDAKKKEKVEKKAALKETLRSKKDELLRQMASKRK